MLINLVILGQLYQPHKVSKTTGSHQPIINTFRQSTSFAIMAHHTRSICLTIRAPVPVQEEHRDLGRLILSDI